MAPRLLFALTLALVAASSCGQDRLSGRPTVIDGDSFTLNGADIRLFGVDAPEGRQSCTRNNSEWRCGDSAASKLKSLIGSSTITCRKRDTDDYGRIVAECHNGSLDLAAEMARAGLAVAYRRYTTAYVDEEHEARAAKRGLWAGEFTRPEDWRRDGDGPRTAAAQNDSGRRDGCYIKGNMNSAGEKIYHTPDSPSYQDTEIDERRGERWFCTAAEARAAGFRAPARRNGR